MSTDVYNVGDFGIRVSPATGGDPTNNILSILPSGAVGIGTTTPTTALDVSGTVTATAFSGSGAGLNSIGGGSITSGQVVKSLNGLADSVTITVGPGVTLTTNGNGLQFAASRNFQFAKLNSDVTTTSATYTNVGLSVTVTNVGDRALVTLNGSISCGSGGPVELRVNRDSGTEFQTLGRGYPASTAVYYISISFQHLFTGLSAGAHTFSVEWRRVTAGTATCNASTNPDQYAMRMSAEELP